MAHSGNDQSGEGSLCDELEAFCKREGLPFMSADELALRDDVTKSQVAWLQAFEERWEEFMRSDESRARGLMTPLELAGAFVTVLREVLPEETFGLCMTGRLSPDDACDSNVVMATAFLRLQGRRAWLPSDAEAGVCSEAEFVKDLDLWNAAISIAASHMTRER